MKPRIALTMGDPNGIGPEILVKTLADPSWRDRCSPLVIGDLAILSDTSAVVGADLTFRPAEAAYEASGNEIVVLQPEELKLPPVRWGQLDAAMGEAAAVCLRTALRLGMAGQVDGFVAAPLNKQAFHLAGYGYLDELAFFADITGSPRPCFMGVIGDILTVSVTEHIAFKDILANLTTENVLWYIRQMHSALGKAHTSRHRIGVAALNPHAGEGGLLGTEEIDLIVPAIEAARAAGMVVDGPVPADVIFPRALHGDFDGIVCMYHDQANIGRKLQPSETGATVYMGLPIVGTTTAHGTAFDIAGRGVADPGSFCAALDTAISFARQGARHQPTKSM
ncbi:MAG: 4-hydroxythreonine-4-phosphate dehydrogenase PdxA [Anaerolineae bacterium]|nr:4-hydroxythreonine-4-phosphate dehydrogenase PdxA [Anaerolineae bacterium]